MISMFYIRLPLVPAKLDNLIGMPRDFLTELIGMPMERCL